MNFLRKNKVKTTAAYFLSALLIFINAVKTFHHHAYTFSAQKQSVNKNETLIHSNVFCSICALQIAKDDDALVATLQVLTQRYFAVAYFTFGTLLSNNYSITSSVRGPPVFVS